MTAADATRDADVAGRLAELVRLADRWGDDSVATGWLVRRARELLRVDLDTRTAFRLIRARRARRGRA